MGAKVDIYVAGERAPVVNVRLALVELCNLEAGIARLGDQRDQLRRDLLAVALDQLDTQGAAPTWRTALGTVGLSVPKAKPTVVDSARFDEFVEVRYGVEAFEIVRRLRPEAFEALVAECSVTATAALVTPDGEQVPGITCSARPPYLFVNLTQEAKLGAAVDLAHADMAEREAHT